MIIDVDSATKAMEVLGDLDAWAEAVIRCLKKFEHDVVCEAVFKMKHMV